VLGHAGQANSPRRVDPGVPYRAVHASRGKRTRAEPIAALYEQGRVHHVGAYPALEDQLCAALHEGGAGPDDRLDALVWAFTELGLAGSELGTPGDHRLDVRDLALPLRPRLRGGTRPTLSLLRHTGPATYDEPVAPPEGETDR
jgi:hypothetical protein